MRLGLMRIHRWKLIITPMILMFFFQVLVDGKLKASNFSLPTIFNDTHTYTLKVDVIAIYRWAMGLSRIPRAMDSKVTRRNSYSFYTSDCGVLRNCTLTPNCANSANSWKCLKFNHHHKASILSFSAASFAAKGNECYIWIWECAFIHI